MKKTPKKKKSTVRTKAEKIKIANKVLDLYTSGNFTLESCANENGITARTLHNWASSISEIYDYYKKAKEENAKANKEQVRDMALNGLKRLLTGYYVDEEDTETMFDKNKKLLWTKKKTKKRYIQPQTAAIIFALKNTDPANWNEDKFSDIEHEEQVFKIGNQIIKF